MTGAYRSGVAASIAAEVVFIALSTMGAALLGKSAWVPLKLPAAFLVGPAAVRPQGFDLTDIALGLLMHVIMSVLVGLAFAAVVDNTTLSPLGAAILAGAVLYAFGFWVLPALFPGWLAPFALSPTGRALQAITHLLYALVFAYTFMHLARGLRHS